MELKKKIGQLFVMGWQGIEPNEEFLEMVHEWGIGGVIIFTRNIDDPVAIPDVIRKIDKASGQKVFSSVDQEGGLVLRVLSGGSLFPGAMALAASGDKNLTERVHHALALEMRALGLNWNLAPVLDVNSRQNPGIGARSFGDSPDDVASFGRAAIRGLRSGGVLACAKHFPGKGSAKIDSHFSLPVISSSREELFACDLKPFIHAIDEGVDAIMTSHVFFPAFESAPNLPGTLSKAVLTGLLRKELGFKGLLITDDLEMGAITEAYGVPEASRLSFLAGSDLLLICHDLKRQKSAMEKILHEVSNSSEAAERLEESLIRIESARKKLNSGMPDKSIFELKTMHADLIQESHKKSILVKEYSEKILPISRNSSFLAVFPEIAMLTPAEENLPDGGMASVFKKHFPRSISCSYKPKDDHQQILASIEGRFEKLDVSQPVVIFSYNAHLFHSQKTAFEAIVQKRKNCILVAVRNPYDVSFINSFPVSIASFGFRTPSIEAICEMLSGSFTARKGPWPVHL
ncbi:MAG: beta-N-acetylhexosaminidase [Candidatus Riflebacteria bacterium]|nr:beta-N-acetylhexosaminidase [Candidatus Riflebacteria bacterium]